MSTGHSPIATARRFTNLELAAEQYTAALLSGFVESREEGVEWPVVSITPEDALGIATRQHQVNEIARLFEIRSSLVGEDRPRPVR